MPEQGPDRDLREEELPKIVFVRKIEEIQFRFRELGVPNMQSIGPIISAAINCYSASTIKDPLVRPGSLQWAQLSDGSIFRIERKFDQNRDASTYVIEKPARP